MLNKLLLYLLLFAGLCISKISFAQINVAGIRAGAGLDINRMEIKDSILITHINQFIKKQLDEDSLFRNKGYIQVFISQSSLRPNVVRSYHINKNYVNFDNIENDKQYPQFYSFLSNKMILFTNFDLFDIFHINYTKKSKLKFRKEIEPYLFKAETIVLPDKNNRKNKGKNFRPNEVFQIGGGIHLYIMNDGQALVER